MYEQLTSLSACDKVCDSSITMHLSLMGEANSEKRISNPRMKPMLATKHSKIFVISILHAYIISVGQNSLCLFSSMYESKST